MTRGGPQGGSGSLITATFVLAFVVFVIGAVLGWWDQLYAQLP
jgi:hypothetical protein